MLTVEGIEQRNQEFVVFQFIDDQLGDITTLADPSVVEKLIENRLNK